MLAFASEPLGRGALRRYDTCNLELVPVASGFATTDVSTDASVVEDGKLGEGRVLVRSLASGIAARPRFALVLIHEPMPRVRAFVPRGQLVVVVLEKLGGQDRELLPLLHLLCCILILQRMNLIQNMSIGPNGEAHRGAKCQEDKGHTRALF